MQDKLILSWVSIGLTFLAFLPYLRDIVRGSFRPHVFSWVIWSATTLVVFFAQLAADGGVGAWPTGVSALMTILIAIAAYRRKADSRITTMDWIFFLAAMSSLPLWYLTSDPLWAVVVLTTVDMLGFGPTLRRVWQDPHAESALFYTVFVARSALSIPALESYSVTTILFPAAIGLGCAALVAVILLRRRWLVG